ncbi:hypothetical protein BC828DRAFT_77043 [Blastocladiella britannica]|nr:hypothetical protein BC828DRAFT_77043 [Blastocladiella britannica]
MHQRQQQPQQQQRQWSTPTPPPVLPPRHSHPIFPHIFARTPSPSFPPSPSSPASTSTTSAATVRSASPTSPLRPATARSTSASPPSSAAAVRLAMPPAASRPPSTNVGHGGRGSHNGGGGGGWRVPSPTDLANWRRRMPAQCCICLHRVRQNASLSSPGRASTSHVPPVAVGQLGKQQARTTKAIGNEDDLMACSNPTCDVVVHGRCYHLSTRGHAHAERARRRRVHRDLETHILPQQQRRLPVTLGALSLGPFSPLPTQPRGGGSSEFLTDDSDEMDVDSDDEEEEEEVALKQVPGWSCDRCLSALGSRVKCVYCPLATGAIRPISGMSGCWAHVVCAAYFLPSASSRRDAYSVEPLLLAPPILGAATGTGGNNPSCSMRCALCPRPADAIIGRFLMCSHQPQCDQQFHASCAHAAGLLPFVRRQPPSQVRVYCPNHDALHQQSSRIAWASWSHDRPNLTLDACSPDALGATEGDFGQEVFPYSSPLD